MSFDGIRAALLLLLLARFGLAGASTGFLEVQVVGGLAGKEPVGYSLHEMDAMQKTSIGLDTLFRFSGERGDWGVLALQGRVAWNPHDMHRQLEPQLFTATFRVKRIAGGDLWLGHARPAYGISSVLDNHALLLPDPAMSGFGFDRDWGAGWIRQFADGEFAASVTTGSGMAFRFSGNGYAAARLSFGVLDRDNYTIGISAGGGRVLSVMGYHILADEPRTLVEGSLDLRVRLNGWEFAAQASAGTFAGSFSALFWLRVSLLLDRAGLWRLEAQPQYVRREGMSAQALYGGFSVAVTADFSLRVMAQVGAEGPDLVLQAYWNSRLW